MEAKTQYYPHPHPSQRYKEQDGAILFVCIQNAGGNLSALGGVAIPSTEDDLSRNGAKLEANNLAGYQAQKLNDHGYGTLG